MAKVGQRPKILDETQFFSDFPSLSRNRKNFVVSSFATEQYNCIALAADDDRHWWWPIDRWRLHDYWPDGCPEVYERDAFIAAFRSLGYANCNDGQFERGIEKIAIFEDALGVTHIAKQPTNRDGLWKSKIGDNADIEHELRLLEGPKYGSVVQYMRRTKNAKRRRKC